VTLALNGLGAVVSVDGKTVTVDRSTDLSGLNAKTIKKLREADALVDSEAPSDERAELAQQGRVSLSPSSTVPEVAAYIERGNDGKPLNASETVALAGDDPAQAQKVLEAEQLAQGDDGRSTVIEPLRKIIASGASA
jgi:hypothetical protein